MSCLEVELSRYDRNISKRQKTVAKLNPDTSTLHFYEQNAESYANTTLNYDLTNLWSLMTNCLTPPAKILDLGCGSGRDLSYFSALGYRVIGVDGSERMAQVATRNSLQRVEVADFQKLPFPASSFDAVWAIASLLHVPRSQISSALAEVQRVLVNGGLFIASVRKGVGERVDQNGRYFCDYQPKEWADSLAKSSFGEIEIRENDEIRHYPNGMEQRFTWIVSICKKL